MTMISQLVINSKNASVAEEFFAASTKAPVFAIAVNAGAPKYKWRDARGNVANNANLTSSTAVSSTRASVRLSPAAIKNYVTTLTIATVVDGIDGTLPALKGFSVLKNLNLFNNNLSGSIPNYSHLTALEDINLTGNAITGDMPNYLSSFPNLKSFQLQNMSFTSGSVPDTSSNPLLETFYVFGTNRTGSMPSFANNTALKFLYVYSNAITGSLPDFTNHTVLVNLQCNSNQLSSFSGGFPATLKTIYLQANQFSATAVNNVLIAADTAGATNGTLFIHQGTNSAPTGAGLTAKTNLQGKGWTVVTN